MVNFEDLNSFKKAIENDFKIKISNLERVQGGFTNLVFKAKFEARDIFIRIDKNRNIYPVETTVYMLLEKIKIPVPKIITYQQNPKNLKYSTMILESAFGKPLYGSIFTINQKRDLHKEAGKILKRIHKIKLRGFGRLKVINNQLRGSEKSWSKVWTKHLFISGEIEYLTKNKLISSIDAKIIYKILDEIKKVRLEKPSLLYADFHGAHIFSDGKKITGVIDPGSAFSGDPRYDIAISLIFIEDLVLQKAFIKGYGIVARDDLVQKYLLMVAVYKTGWRHRKGLTNGAKKALAVLKRQLKLFNV